MQTHFTEEQLRDPGLRHADKILRSCVHCGFCTATCPTYQVLGDELDSPRGRIYLIKEMLESGRAADARTVKHIDRCLSCLACMTTCPSGVHYMHLVDQARDHIEATYRRPLFDRVLRWALSRVLPYPGRFRLALWAARFARPLGAFLPDPRLRAMVAMAPRRIASASRADNPQVFAAQGPRRMRVALMTGCAQRALNPDINDATVRLLRRLGAEVVIVAGSGCCGALTHHLGRKDDALRSAAENIRVWTDEQERGGLDAIVINTSGCGTVVKDYGHMFGDSDLADAAARIAGLAMDVTEVVARLMPQAPVAARLAEPLRVAYHSACSLQHGQKIRTLPKELLLAAGFEVVEPVDSHLCCGSAGTYNLLQPEISGELKRRKVASIEAREPDVVAAGNIGCMMQIASATSIPVVHTVELLDWAAGGPRPRALQDRRAEG